MLKNIIFSGIGLTLLVLPLGAAADTEASSTNTQIIQGLVQQIQELTKQLTQLRGHATGSNDSYSGQDNQTSDSNNGHGNQASVSTTQAPAGASCVSYKTTYASGATVGCSVQPGSGVACPLGIGFNRWKCTDGQWVKKANNGGNGLNWFDEWGSSTSTENQSSDSQNGNNGWDFSHATTTNDGRAAGQGGSQATSTCFALTRDVSPGDNDTSTGGSVSKLQQFLHGTGDYTYPNITGYYGTSTREAVQHWQSRNNVVNSGDWQTTGFGRVGQKTRDSFSHWCGAGTQPEASGGTDVSTTTGNETIGTQPSDEAASSSATSTKPINPVRCITPWGGYSVQNGSTMSYRPYFTDGSFEGTSTALMRCDNGGWLKCDTQGSTCQHFLGSLSQVLSGQ